MSYELIPDAFYRMPSHFGPSPGPRQKLDGTKYTAEEAAASTCSVSVSFLTDAKKLDARLPPGFSLFGDPIVNVTCTNMKNLWWLAGRGYNMYTVNFPATFNGEEQLSGGFVPVLWENLFDPIMTGREELGFPKLWAEIPDIDERDGTARTSASWLGFEFSEIVVKDLVESAEPPIRRVGPSIFYKVIPRTGHPGEFDCAYVTTSAPAPTGEVKAANPTPPAPSNAQYWKGSGSVRFNEATFEQLPTLMHIVNKLADLDVIEVVAAGMTKTTSGAMGLAGQRIVK